MFNELISPTKGKINIQTAVEMMRDFILENPKSKFEIAVGTATHTNDASKMTCVVYLHRIGNGAIYFFNPCVENNNKKSMFYGSKRYDEGKLRKKTTAEVAASKMLAMSVLKEFDLEFERTGFLYLDYDISFAIHCGVNARGSTSVLVPEILAWTKINNEELKSPMYDICNTVNEIFETVVKPDDNYSAFFVASKLA